MNPKYYVGGFPIRHHLADEHEFMLQKPKYLHEWARADCIYRWIGCVIRLKQRHWAGRKDIPYGLVVEAGPGSWLAALWTDERDPRDNLKARQDIDCWWPPNIYDLKRDMLARKYSEEQLLTLLRGLDFSDLTIVR